MLGRCRHRDLSIASPVSLTRSAASRFTSLAWSTKLHASLVFSGSPAVSSMGFGPTRHVPHTASQVRTRQYSGAFTTRTFTIERS